MSLLTWVPRGNGLAFEIFDANVGNGVRVSIIQAKDGSRRSWTVDVNGKTWCFPPTKPTRKGRTRRFVSFEVARRTVERELVS